MPTELRLEIDDLRLDEEWMGQAAMFHSACIVQADADAEVGSAKSNLDVTKAELDADIRTNYKNYGFEKNPTEAAILVCIPGQTPYVLAMKRLNKARYNADIAGAAVKALEHRKSALKGLVDLYINDYWAAPRASKGNGEEVNDMERRVLARKGIRQRVREHSESDG